MKYLILQIILLTGTLLCSSSHASPPHKLEPLYQIGFQSDGVTIQVRSNGCTKKDHFALYWQSGVNMTGSLAILGIVRKIPDRCRAKPRLVTLTLNDRIPEATNIYVDNPFAVSKD
ncbi:MAG: hypothetical protein AB2650_00575 [Candidatus Thiodiazotropha taylori]